MRHRSTCICSLFRQQLLWPFCPRIRGGISGGLRRSSREVSRVIELGLFISPVVTSAGVKRNPLDIAIFWKVKENKTLRPSQTFSGYLRGNDRLKGNLVAL